jgi:hypothetical protein
MSADAWGRISDIRPGEDAGRGLCLVLDVDWACDAVLESAIDTVEAAGIRATWFATHETPLLDRIRANSGFELGIHPNFGDLLAGDDRNGATAGEVLDRMLAVVPEARSVRSHSLVHGTRIGDLFASRGLTHDANDFIPASSGMELHAWRAVNGMVRVPFLWEDDFACADPSLGAVEALAARPGLRVFAFHPIHLALNTESLARYEATRGLHRDPAALARHRFDGVGTASWLAALLAATSTAGMAAPR